MENGLVAAYENMDRDQLISVITQQKMEINELAAVGKAYKQHLEQVIEYHSVEKYRSVVQKNREADDSIFNEIKMKFNVSNLVELKKLIKLAQNQVNQLEETLELIEKFKIQVS
ncbi:hypothetical protein KD905_00230 [Enterococcus faecium]|uniref:hypothetical protein n=1 Tax=Enterococcus faecium TaxID=1352 RepID=UPI0024BA5716|nr:hypothetical protein [Enterococcus faecium]UXD43169.1 hypothetical protein E3T57_00165 [Enterococcus faecium]